MSIHYFGKRRLVGEILSQENVSETFVIIDAVGASKNEILRFLEESEIHSYRRLFVLALGSSLEPRNPIEIYYHNLFNQIRSTTENCSRLLTSAILQELEPYLIAGKDIYGSYGKGEMSWTDASSLKKSIVAENVPNTTIIESDIQATVPIALSSIAPSAHAQKNYHYVSPDILQGHFRDNGLGKGDLEIINQLPYYQYFSYHWGAKI